MKSKHIIFLEVIIGIIAIALSIIWINKDRAEPEPYITLLVSILPLVDAIRRIRKPDVFTDEQHFVLSYISTDPQAATRGSWLYPLHQQLTYRGYKKSEVTTILSELEEKKIIQYVKVSSYNDLLRKKTKAPAYKITPKGIDYISRNKQLLPKIQDTYYYTIRLYGEEQDNQLFLEALRELDFVQQQTRFITDNDEGFCTIAVFSYMPISEMVVRQLEKIHKVRILTFKEDN
ncbi:hypothetical protein [Negadavirga shengliensis]|uniref:Uncharacterized protein n=1 Tax=Negadavirga shengliensis TaxID=1389218 RepID=A0ABV9T8E1_9BACT